MSFVLVTDSTANLTDELIKRYSIEILPLTYTINGEEKLSYSKGEATDLKSFYAKMREGAKVSTSCVNVDAARAFFEPFLIRGDDVLYLGFSSGLSATYSNAATAAAELSLKYPARKILTVDTLAASMGQGLIAVYAAIERDKGKTVEQVREYVEGMKLSLCHQFTVDDLMYLKRGGRVGGGTAIIGTILKIKPILHVDNAGHLIPKSKAIGRKAAIKAIFNKYVEKAENKSDQIVFVSHGDCEDDARTLIDMVLSLPEKPREICVNYIDQVIGAHSGPGTLAIFFLGKNRES